MNDLLYLISGRGVYPHIVYITTFITLSVGCVYPEGAMVRGLSDRGQLRRGVPQQPAREAAWLARGTTATEGKGCSPLVALSDAGAPSMSCKAWDWALLRVHHSQAKKAGQGGGVDGQCC